MESTERLCGRRRHANIMLLAAASPTPSGLPGDCQRRLPRQRPAVRALLFGVRRTFEPRGWKPAGTLVPLADIGWSLWLLALGVGLLVTA